jgi:hypothetical protein
MGNRRAAQTSEPFRPGPDPRRNTSAGPRPKILMRCEALLLEQLQEIATDEACIRLSMPLGSTWNELRARALVLAAAGLWSVDVSAQRLLFEVIERQATQAITVNVLNVDVQLLEKAKARVLRELSVGLLPPTANR